MPSSAKKPVVKKATSAKKTPVTKKTVTSQATKMTAKPVVKTTTSKLAAALSQAKNSGITSIPAVTDKAESRAWLKSATMNKVLIVAWILVILGALYYFKGQFVVATVNGQPIFRSALIKQLEAQSGKEVLDNLILETLVRQEASAKKITVSDEELEGEIKQIQERLAAQKQDLDQLLSLQGMTRATLKDQIKLQLLVEKLVDKTKAQVTDEEIKKYLADNKTFLPKDAKPEELAVQVRSQLEQQKMTALTQDWLKSLQTKATVNHWFFVTK
jgi:hypothetical protein